jgi:abequosyltransferase
MQYKLSICIPTYNRAKYLPELLDSIISQVNLENPIEICVSDNASEDHTAELIEKYKRHYPHLVYFRWPKNMGADRNYLKVIEIASGEYCWFMGSDDKLVSGAVDKVIGCLGNERDIILCERIECDVNMVQKEKRKLLSGICQNKEFNFNNDDDFATYAFHAENLAAFFSYLSCIIFIRSKWLQIRCDDRMIGSLYSHVYMLLMYCNTFPKNVLLYLPQPLVLCRGYNDSFLSGNVAQRTLLDLNGYELIAKLLFFYQPTKYRSVLLVLEKEMKKSMCFKSLLFKRFFSHEETYSALCIGYRYLYGDIIFGIKFWFCNALHRPIFLRKIIKRCLGFIRHKILKRAQLAC